MKFIRRILFTVLPFTRQVSRDKVSVYAAQAAFFIIISAVPLVMLLLSLLQYIMPMTQSQLSALAMDVIPLAMRSHVIRIIDELYTQTSAPLVSITAITSLWAASRSVYALTRGLNEVYKTAETRNYFQMRFGALFYTLMLILLLIFSLLILVFGNRIQYLIEAALPVLARFSAYIISIRTLLAISLMTLCFALMYKILPNTRSHFRHQLPGALFASLGWMIFSLVYSIYIDNFSNFSYTYGSLAAVVFMMLWLYSCMNILLIGAEINVWLFENPRRS
ncbi:MAG: YihY/virulence factor BrkB family protein [Lachnospiraceae bacterium]|jgi:membrane protein|nr:YihY/virulence factor BrkB family protein [Lachnospiraceae bacterium]